MNIPCIETLIDYRKLQFMGQLCRLSNQYLAKTVLNHRLVRYANHADNQTLGFLPEVYRLIQKYELQQYVDLYLESGEFPTNYMWKSILKRNVLNREKSDRVERLKDNELYADMFDSALSSTSPSLLWTVMRENMTLSNTCRTLNTMLGTMVSREFPLRCNRCNRMHDNIVVHNVCFCLKMNCKRNTLWDNLLRTIGIQEFVAFTSMTPVRQCAFLVRCAVDNLAASNTSGVLASSLCALFRE